MTALPVTALYAGLFAILFAVLSTLAALGRGQTGIVLGDGGDPGLALKLRRFGNLAEYVPMALVVMMLLEASGLSAPLLHAYGGTLLALRLLHPVALFADPGAGLARKAGRFVAAAGTALILALGGALLVLRAF